MEFIGTILVVIFIGEIVWNLAKKIL